MAYVVNGVVIPAENTNSFRYRRKHQRPGLSFTAATLSIMGCNLSASIVLFLSSMASDIYACQSLFFGGVILSVILTSALVKVFRKVMHYFISAILLIISGALFTSYSYSNLNIDLLKAAFFVSGASFGMSLLTFIIHAGELSVKHLRGSVINYIQLGIDAGILCGMLILNYFTDTGLHPSSVNPIQVIGIVKLIWGILALPAAFFLVYESPIFLLEHNNEQQAIKNLIELRKEPNSMTYEIKNEFENIKATLRNASNSLINSGELIPFIKVFACRFAYTLGTSIPVNVCIMSYYRIYTLNSITYTLYIGRFLAIIISGFLIDGFLGRKLTLLISFIGSGIFLVIIQIMITSSVSSIIPDTDYIQTAGLLTVFYNIFLGLGGSSVSYTYMSEVFNHSSKAFLNSLIIILEYVVHLIIIQFPFSTFEINGAEILIFTTAGVQIVVGALSYALLPETKGKTLLEAEDKIKNLITLQR